MNFVAHMTKNTIPILVGGRNTSALIDSGASVTIINKDFFLAKTQYAQNQLLPPTFRSVKGASGKVLPVLGQIDLEISINGR